MNPFLEEIKRLADEHGGLITPELVVTEAASATSPLHPAFEWDNYKAANQHRLNQARNLIAAVRIEVTYRTQTVNVIGYVHDPRVSKEQGYVNVTVLTERDRQLQVLAAECMAIRGRVIRLREIARGFDLVQEGEERLAAVVD